MYLTVRPDLRPGSVAQYENAVAHWERFFGDAPVEQTDCASLARFAAHLSVGRSPQTVNKILRHCLSLLRTGGLHPVWRRLREPWHAPVAFLSEEFVQVLQAARSEPGTVTEILAGDWWESFLLSLWYTGSRVGAMLAVTSRDVLLDRGGLFVRAECQKQHADQFFSLGQDAIEAIRRIYSAERPAMWPWPFRRETVYRRFRVICERAGVEVGSGTGTLFHRIRKSTASYMRLNGGDATSHLGHSAAHVTARYMDPRIVGQHDARSFLPRLS